MKDVVKHSEQAINISSKPKRNLTLHYAVVISIILALAAILSMTVFFKTESVTVTGSSVYAADEIIAASGINAGDNMIRKNMAGISEDILEKLVYIEEAEVKRVFPSTISISVNPAHEIANIEIPGGGYYVISEKGKILSALEEPREELMIFRGTDPMPGLIPGEEFESEDSDKPEIIRHLHSISKSSLEGNIREFDLSDRTGVTCLYDDRITIELGLASDMDYKFKLAGIIIDSRIGKSEAGTLTMLSNGATFIDKEGLRLNEEIYLRNLEADLTPERSESENPENMDLH